MELKFDYQPYGISFSSLFTKTPRLVVSSFEETDQNFVEIYAKEQEKYVLEQRFKTKLPPSKVLFSPTGSYIETDHFLLTDISLKVYCLSNHVELVSEFPKDGNLPITATDWSKHEPNLIVFCSTDGIATLYDVKTNQQITTIAAHEHPIFDVNFCPNSTSFVTAGFDGSIRIFDSRDLNSSLIFYQASMPIQKICASPFQNSKFALLCYNSTRSVLVDNRYPGVPFSLIGTGESRINALAWSKMRPGRIYTATEDNNVYSCEIISTKLNSECAVHGISDSMPQNMAIGPDIFGVLQDHSLKFFADQ